MESRDVGNWLYYNIFKVLLLYGLYIVIKLNVKYFGYHILKQ